MIQDEMHMTHILLCKKAILKYDQNSAWVTSAAAMHKIERLPAENRSAPQF